VVPFITILLSVLHPVRFGKVVRPVLHPFPVGAVYKVGRCLPYVNALLCRHAFIQPVPALYGLAGAVKLGGFPNQLPPVIKYLHAPSFQCPILLHYKGAQLACAAGRHKCIWYIQLPRYTPVICTLCDTVLSQPSRLVTL
jgi:hypothetical protein